MALKPCRECGQEVSTEANACPNCGVKNPTRSGGGSISGCTGCLGIGAAASIILMLGLWIGGDGSSGGSSGPAHDEVSAFTMCQSFTEDRLRAPSSADWPCCYPDFTTHLGGGRYRVETYVDAENAFGAQVRSDVMCEVEYAGGDRWTLESISIE